MSDAPVRFRYMVASAAPRTHHVFVVHDDSPDWWRLVATFGSRDRADSYCEVENEIADDEDATREDSWRREDCASAPKSLPAPPQTRVVSENFRRPSPAEKARVGAALIEDAGRETGVKATVAIEPPKPAPAPPTPAPSKAPVAEKRPQGHPAMSEDEAERPKRRMLHAVNSSYEAGLMPSLKELSRLVAMPEGSVSELLDRLAKQGLITRDQQGWRPRGKPPLAPKAGAPVKPPSADDAQVAEWLAKNRASRPENEPDVDTVMNEIRRDGTIVVPTNDKFTSFTINNGGPTIDRKALIARANRSRTRRGMPLLDLGKVKWERPPEPELEQRRGKST